MSDREPDHQLTGDDPMMDQIEVATYGTKKSQDAVGHDPTGLDESDPVEPGESESARFEPDASQ